MLKIHFSWGGTDLPEYDPEKHNPERVFAMLCYRGIHYAKWVYLQPFNINNWNLFNPDKQRNNSIIQGTFWSPFFVYILLEFSEVIK